jgi:transposase
MIGRKVIEGEMTYREAAKTFGVSHGSVSLYVRRFKKNKGWGNAAKIKEANEKHKDQRLEYQVRELKHEIAELYLENLMLKKALQFSQQVKRESSSVITSENLDLYQKVAK